MKYLRDIVEQTKVDLHPKTKDLKPEDTKEEKKKQKNGVVDQDPRLDHEDEALQTTKRRHLNERQQKFLPIALRRLLDQEKRKQKVVQVAPDLTKSGSFPEVDESYEHRMNECKRLKEYLADINRPIVGEKVDRIMGVLRRHVFPIYEEEV